MDRFAQDGDAGQRHKISGIANEMPLQPQIRFAVAARVKVVWFEKGAQRRARPEVRDGLRRKGEGPILFEQREIEDQVFAEVEPFGVAADALPGGFGEGHAAARWQKCFRLNLVKLWQNGCAHRYFKGCMRIGQEKSCADYAPPLRSGG